MSIKEKDKLSAGVILSKIMTEMSDVSSAIDEMMPEERASHLDFSREKEALLYMIVVIFTARSKISDQLKERLIKEITIEYIKILNNNNNIALWYQFLIDRRDSYHNATMQASDSMFISCTLYFLKLLNINPLDRRALTKILPAYLSEVAHIQSETLSIIEGAFIIVFDD